MRDGLEILTISLLIWETRGENGALYCPIHQFYRQLPLKMVKLGLAFSLS